MKRNPLGGSGPEGLSARVISCLDRLMRLVAREAILLQTASKTQSKYLLFLCLFYRRDYSRLDDGSPHRFETTLIVLVPREQPEGIGSMYNEVSNDGDDQVLKGFLI